METQTEEKITLNINQRNVPLLMSAIELKIKNLEKIQKACLKEKQPQSARDMQPDINRLEELLKRLTPLKPVPLPLSLQ